MIHPIRSSRLLQNGKKFSFLKLIILQQNIASVWIFGDQFSWNQRGHEMDMVLQQLGGTIPMYVYDFNTTKTVCMDHNDIKVLNIIFVSQSDNLNCVCPTDYTIVLVPNTTTEIRLPRKRSSNVLQRIVFGTIGSSDIDENNNSVQDGPSSLIVNTKALHNLFFPKPLKFDRSSVLRIGLQLRPPTTMLYFLNNACGFYGTDALLADEISKMLNMTLTIQSNVGIEYPKFLSWFNDSNTRFRLSVKLLSFRNRMIPPKPIYNFYRNCSHDDVDMCITGHPLRKTNINRTTFLYPLYKECLRIVVPLIKVEQQFAEKLGNHTIIQSICLGIVLMFLSKIILSGPCRVRHWSHTFNVILAELFGQKRPIASTKFWEKVWNVQILLIAVFSTALLAAISYETLVSVKYVKQIDTLDDLIESDLRIFVEQFRSRDFDRWGENLDPRLRSKFVYQKELLNAVQKPNYAAFVWDEGMAWIHIRLSEAFAKNGKSGEMRLAKEPLYCGFTSSRILSDSVFRHSINTLHERLFTSGIRMEQMEWSIQFIRTLNPVNGTSGGALQPLTLYRIYGILVLLLGGLGLGCIIFILEIFWKRFERLRKGSAIQLHCLNGKDRMKPDCQNRSNYK